MKRFHHLELYCGDASNTSRRFAWGLGLAQVAKSDHSTGNPLYASYVLQSQELVFVFTAPYAPPSPSFSSSSSNNGVPITNIADAPSSSSSSIPHPAFSPTDAAGFFTRHGLAIRAVGIEVEDAHVAYEECVAHGGKGVLAAQVGEGDGKGGREGWKGRRCWMFRAVYEECVVHGEKKVCWLCR